MVESAQRSLAACSEDLKKMSSVPFHSRCYFSVHLTISNLSKTKNTQTPRPARKQNLSLCTFVIIIMTSDYQDEQIIETAKTGCGVLGRCPILSVVAFIRASAKRDKRSLVMGTRNIISPSFLFVQNSEIRRPLSVWVLVCRFGNPRMTTQRM